jgi:hypothetical protein
MNVNGRLRQTNFVMQSEMWASFLLYSYYCLTGRTKPIYSTNTTGCTHWRIWPNVVFQQPVALHRPGYAFWFYAVYVQRRLIFSIRLPFIDINFCGITGHLQGYRLLWLRNLLLTVILFCFSYVAPRRHESKTHSQTIWRNIGISGQSVLKISHIKF